MTSSRYAGLKVVVAFACELIILFSFVFCLVSAAYKIEFRLFLNLISNEWRQVDHGRCSESGCHDMAYIFLCFLLAWLSGGGGRALPMLLNLNLFSSVEDSIRFSAPNFALRGESRSFDSGFLQRFVKIGHEFEMAVE